MDRLQRDEKPTTNQPDRDRRRHHRPTAATTQTSSSRYGIQPTDVRTQAQYSPEEYQKKYRLTLDERSASRADRNQLPTTDETTMQQTAAAKQQQYAAQRQAYVAQAQLQRRQQQKLQIQKQQNKKLPFPKRVIVYSINGIFYTAQVMFGIMLIASLGISVLVEANAFTRVLNNLLDSVFNRSAHDLLGVFLILCFSLGALKLLTIGFVLKFMGAHPLFGTRSAVKVSLCLGALVLYSLPFSNLLPWSFVWSWYVSHNPK